MNDSSPARVNPVLAYLVVAGAFAGGILLDRSGVLPGADPAPTPQLSKLFVPFWESWNLVDRHYVDRDAVQPERMTRGAIQGMLNSLGDTGHTTYLAPEEVAALKESLKGEFEGVGARMTVRKSRPTVVDVLPNSPAAAAGLKAGDVLVKVNDKDVAGMPLTEVVRLVRGPAGTTVRLGINRGSDKVTLEIPRGKVEVDDVTWHRLPGTAVAHIALHDFGRQADVQLRAAFRAAVADGVRGLILDVRGNPGGLRDQAIAVTSEFLKDGTVFIEQDAKGNRTNVPVISGGIALDIPIVVLTDEGTASSAEIFAGAIQDHDRGKLIGTRTFGTGTVLQPFPLRDGSAVLLAVKEWLTPKGRQIWHKGIEPDVTVTLPADTSILLPHREGELSPSDLRKTEDLQLLRALEVLEKQIEHGPNTAQR
jgi:carboxyl-terminal processing protease